jgi:hypothetical protein
MLFRIIITLRFARGQGRNWNMYHALKSPWTKLTLLGLISAASSVFAATGGSVFITGHDPVWHSNFGGNAAGAKNLAETAIDYARNGNVEKFLFVEAYNDPIPGGNAYENPFLSSSLKYSGQYDVMNYEDLFALSNFRTTLNNYSAIVVASDHGGMLGKDELAFLNGHSSDIIDYINDGGGLAAFAESNAALQIGTTPRFQFLPFLVSSSDFQTGEVGNTVTAYGSSLGLVDSDVNGNFSHNFFSGTGGMTPVDLYNGDRQKPLSLASRGTFTDTGVNVPEITSSLGLLAFGFLVTAGGRRMLAR